METIRKWREQMEYEYECLLDLLDEFEANPLVSTRKKIKEQMTRFNYTKNVLATRISDYWCRYE